MPEPPDDPPRPPEDDDPFDEDEFWFEGKPDEDDYLERIDDLKEQLTRQTLVNEQLLSRLQRERTERNRERRDDGRWFATQRTALISMAVVILTAILGSILYQISSLNEECALWRISTS